jgi:hypothetical protein
VVNTGLISGGTTYRNVNVWLKSAIFQRIGSLFGLISCVNHAREPEAGAAEVVLAMAIHSLLFATGSYCRRALTGRA